ncbi:heme NO-binding domain-containing protein [Alloalcanivorax sp. C16-2]|uniref:heme NO-binding domain-containing protein n=1 Tax=Alloalcanivorax TaxID=3020832 RepID=UPI001931BCE4|nr:heme NO-binding domain-containing protein [Alloalcanivorax marinus]MBL7251515.1 heme NO-binding domain-containing protein [Alloalcanivorax marinus]
MHGVILYQFRHFVTDRFGPGVWEGARRAAGLADQAHAPVRLYPDAHLERLLVALEDEVGLCRNDLLESFGAWTIPPLIKMYRSLIPAHWDARDFLLNLEEHIHEKLVRLKDPQAQPPRIQVRETAPGVLELYYHSHRDLSALAVGAVYGVAGYFGEKAELMENEPVRGGHRRFVFRLTRAESRRPSLTAV